MREPAFENLRDRDSSSIEAPLPASSVHDWKIQCDVLVIGYGVAGASAALEAADRGLDVVLIDRFRGGGSSQLSGGIVYAGGGTPVQRECKVEDSAAAMADYLEKEVAGTVSRETVRRFCEDSIDTLAFLSRAGVQFSGPRAPKKTSYPTSQYYLYFSDNDTVPAYRGTHPPAERGHRVKDPSLVPGAPIPPGKKPHGGFSEGADVGWYLMAAMKQAVAKHPRIRVLLQTRASRLIRADDGRIIGAEVRMLKPRGPGGALHRWAEAKAANLTLQLMGLALPFRRLMNLAETTLARRQPIRANHAVILAAGGYIRNKAMMQRYAAAYLETFPIGSFGDDGAGVRLGVSAGGVADHLHRISAWRFINPPYDWIKGVIIGTDGRRITNEEQYGAHIARAIYEQSAGKAWLVLDHALMNSALDSVRTGNLFGFQQFPVTQAQKNAIRADTVEQLAEKLGVPAGAMRADIDAYSAAAVHGTPDPMGKSDDCRTAFRGGPFYAVDLSHKLPTNPTTSISTGGLRVNETTGAVVDSAGRPIPGLYAAGRSAVGIPSNNYVSGLSLADGVWSGRRAAGAIADSSASIPEAPRIAAIR